MTAKIDANGVLFVRKAEADSKAATIVVTGDTCPRAGGEKLILEGRAAEIMAPAMGLFKDADLSVMQFETALTRKDTPILKSGPNLRCDPKTIELLNVWGGDVALMANNHTGDFGPDAIMETLGILQDNGFKTVGAGANLDEAYKPLVLDVNGIRVGILNFAENEFGGALHNAAGSAPLDPCLNIRQIAELAAKVDVCMVVTHGGNEGNPVPSPRVVEMSRAFVDAGADAVINIHTHCPQGMEVYKNAAIVYSLGNFYFPWPSDRPYPPKAPWINGYVAELTIDKDGVLAVKAIPTTFDADGAFVKPLGNDKTAKFAAYLNKISEPLQNWRTLVELHEAWAANSGYPTMFRQFDITNEMFEKPTSRLMALRNLFTCEAHSEVVRTYMKLVEQGRLETAAKNIGKITELANLDYID